MAVGCSKSGDSAGTGYQSGGPNENLVASATLGNTRINIESSAGDLEIHGFQGVVYGAWARDWLVCQRQHRLWLSWLRQPAAGSLKRTLAVKFTGIHETLNPSRYLSHIDSSRQYADRVIIVC